MPRSCSDYPLITRGHHASQILIDMKKAGANFVARERFGTTRENVQALKDFNVTYGCSGRAARAAMKQRLAEAKSIMPEPVSAGFVEVKSNLQFAYAV